DPIPCSQPHQRSDLALPAPPAHHPRSHALDFSISSEAPDQLEHVDLGVVPAVPTFKDKCATLHRQPQGPLINISFTEFDQPHAPDDRMFAVCSQRNSKMVMRIELGSCSEDRTCTTP